MSKELDLKENYDLLESPKMVQDLVIRMPEYNNMLQVLNSNLPQIKDSTQNFNKTQSQFMDNMLTVSHLTPLRNVRQILAEMNKTEAAMKEAYINSYRKEVEIEIKKRDLQNEEDTLKQKLIQLDILELHTQLESIKGSIGGAIRKMTNYSEQYNSIVNAYNLHNFTEEDFEKEEEKHHIMKAFDQGVTAARSRGNIIDEGNLIYLTQIGINGSSAQKDVSEYLLLEAKLLQEGKEPTHKMHIMFLENMATKYSGSARKLAEYKGMSKEPTKVALLGAKNES